MSVNQVHLLGRCGQDPEVRIVGQNNVKRAGFSLCTGNNFYEQCATRKKTGDSVY